MSWKKIFERKKESIEDIDADLRKLKAEVRKERKLVKKEKHRAELLNEKKQMTKDLFAEKKHLEKDLKDMEFRKSKVGKAVSKAAEVEHNVEGFLQKPGTKKALHEIDKFLFG